MLTGVKIIMGGTEYIVPPLTLGQLRRLQEKIKQFTSMALDGSATEEQFDAIGTVVAAALSRNYPDMTPEKVLDLLDMSNWLDVLHAILSSSGLRQGEARAATGLNGATSTDFSPPLLDTATP